MNLREEWNKILEESQAVYIYGAGKIGRKIYGLMKESGQLDKLKGFVVSDTVRGGWNPNSIEEKTVIAIKNLKEKNSTILVSVSDRYQNEILELLQKTGFTNVICAYKYAFLDEADVPQDMPETIMIDLRELMAQQYDNGRFNRFDIIVRLLAVRNYYGENDFGFALYRRMQDFRVQEGYADTAEKRFRALISSFEEHGYDTASEILVDRNLKLVDGSHRLSLAIYHNLPQVRVRVLDRFTDISFGLDWFAQYFSGAQCRMLEECLESASAKWLLPIKGIIWSAASEYADEITEEIRRRYKVCKLVDYDFPKEIYQRFVYGVYHVDDIAEWKVKTKLEHFGEQETYRVRMLDIHMPYPDFRIKRTGTTLSREGERLKKIIRDGWQDKVENYFPDIIFHTADNYSQSEYMEALTGKAFPLREMFECIDDLEWMLIKSENDYFPKDFPDAYPAYKDIDLICLKGDAEKICLKISEFFKENVNEPYSVRKTEKQEESFMLRIELQGFLIFAVEVIYADKYLTDDFISESLSRRVKRDGYYSCPMRAELVYRLIEFYKRPDKKKHLQYVLNHLECFDRSYFMENISPQYAQALRLFVEENIDK